MIAVPPSDAGDAGLLLGGAATTRPASWRPGWRGRRPAGQLLPRPRTVAQKVDEGEALEDGKALVHAVLAVVEGLRYGQQYRQRYRQRYGARGVSQPASQRAGRRGRPQGRVGGGGRLRGARAVFPPRQRRRRPAAMPHLEERIQGRV